ncbi:C-C motif chemokine 24 [Tenrec ecaudatus]|uniref:C-C motif chemokine 24 n=1 Tax=Tenrec ecaudatus TaxID=94439 RepID=UPI003F5A63EE
MAGPVTLFASLLLLALCTDHIALSGPVATPSACCMNFISKKISMSRVVSYQLSSASICPKAGVIFTTKLGRKLCADPKQSWVQSYIKNLKTPLSTKEMGRRPKARRHPANSTTI